MPSILLLALGACGYTLVPPLRPDARSRASVGRLPPASALAARVDPAVGPIRGVEAVTKLFPLFKTTHARRSTGGKE